MKRRRGKFSALLTRSSRCSRYLILPEVQSGFGSSFLVRFCVRRIYRYAPDHLRLLLPAELHDRKAGKSVLGKRKADGSDSGGGLQRAVKKLILDAQAVSPGSAGSHAQSTPRTEASAISPTTQQNAAYEAAMAAGPSGDFSNMFMGSQQFPSFPMGVSAAGMPGTMAPAAQAYNQLAQPNSNGNFDVSLESMLATYLPNTNAPSGPDDFMNRVFSVSCPGFEIRYGSSLHRLSPKVLMGWQPTRFRWE